jgi:20S proteasome alpha/beta subunit
MTVIVALKCPSGVVLAADSQATTAMLGGVPMKLPTKKIEQLGPNVVYAGTGGQGAGQRVQNALTAQEPSISSAASSSAAVDIIRAVVNPIQKAALDEWIQLPNSQPEVWGGIFCGFSSDGLWIYEIDTTGAAQFHSVFAATGSGHPVAHAALMNVAHFDVATQSLEATKAIAYRAIETTCASSAWAVGLPVQVAIVTPEGVQGLTEGALEHTELKELVDLWKAKEVETLGELAPVRVAVQVTEPTGAENTIDASEIGPANT